MAETNIKDFLMETVGSPNREEEVKLKRFKSPFKILRKGQRKDFI